MISFDEALGLVRQNRFAAGTEWVALEAAVDRILGEDVSASHASPRFDNSAVDGFAVSSESPPWNIVATLAAGDRQTVQLVEGEAARIMTGAPTPNGCFAVVMQEDCRVSGNTLFTELRVGAGQNVRRQGEEFTYGDLIVKSGTRITPPILGALRALGLPEAPVRSMPRVAIVSTGSELVEPGIDLEPSQIFESDSLPLATILRGFGATVLTAHAADDPEATMTTVEGALSGVDLLLTTGGASVGAFDFVPATMADLGFETVFSKVAMKPGKPVAFATRRDGKAWFGLPGNPMSAQATFLLLVLAYIDRELAFLHLPLLNEHRRKPGREEFVPADLYLSGESGIEVLASVGSHATTGFAVSNGMARIPADVESLSSGDRVAFALFPWSQLP